MIIFLLSILTNSTTSNGATLENNAPIPPFTQLKDSQLDGAPCNSHVYLDTQSCIQWCHQTLSQILLSNLEIIKSMEQLCYNIVHLENQHRIQWCHPTLPHFLSNSTILNSMEPTYNSNIHLENRSSIQCYQSMLLQIHLSNSKIFKSIAHLNNHNHI
mmetsp:Transcript_36976/g.52242  ORF Transcript_36976/g.52242 Transcript_36976/m.52242 type:complete len:158 (-) Transcript_36976:671-1144(-)